MRIIMITILLLLLLLLLMHWPSDPPCLVVKLQEIVTGPEKGTAKGELTKGYLLSDLLGTFCAIITEK